METKDTCLYIHTRKSDGGIFYVGIGNEKRPKTKSKRNKFWKSVVNKHGFDFTILKTNMSWEEACDLEIKMIAFYGRIKPHKKNPNYGCLVNMTDGGDGSKGCSPNEETRKKQRERNKGKNNPRFGVIVNEETKQKIRENTKKSMKNEEIRKKMRGNRAAVSGGNNPAAKKVICNVTNKIYNTIKDAAKDIGIKTATLSTWLNGTRKNKSSLRFL